jgi:hypothetical protein
LYCANKYAEILKVESKYRHLDTFSNDPAQDVFILTVFGKEHAQEETLKSLQSFQFNPR